MKLQYGGDGSWWGGQDPGAYLVQRHIVVRGDYAADGCFITLGVSEGSLVTSFCQMISPPLGTTIVVVNYDNIEHQSGKYRRNSKMFRTGNSRGRIQLGLFFTA